MSTEIVKTVALPESDTSILRKHVMDAVEVMFNRAVEHGADDPEPQDAKDEVKDNKLNPSGPLQNCEFGFALLIVRNWLGDAFFATIDKTTYETVLLALINKTVKRVLLRNQSDKGGGGVGEHAAFFTGEPYTEFSKGQNFSANLDAAMITLAFLSLAVSQFNEELVGREHGLDPADRPLPDWVGSLRDAALFVIQEGLEYAQQCRVVHKNTFLGFTSDPESNAAAPANGSLEDEDRLFFTWTACETIYDLISWRESYLSNKTSPAPPKPAVDRLVVLIDELKKSLLNAASWSEAQFLEKFGTFEPPENRELVKEIGGLRIGAALTPTQQLRVDAMAKSVQQVYLMSQYAAIRSLVPESITPSEVGKVIDQLDLLVQKSILESRLDEAEHPVLYRTLTRSYSLGKSNPESYKDDAWYPLVVRSLSGLLARTLQDIGTRFSRPEVMALTLTFKKSLQNHVRKMIERRPRGGESGPDVKLWSFAGDQPYVLYATQRTIFALIKYEEFLVAVDQFEKEVPDVEKREVEFSMIFANQFMEFFRPAIKKLLLQVPATSDDESGNIANSVNGLGGIANTPADGELPSELWAAATIRRWLKSLTSDFNKAQVANNIEQQVISLKMIKKYADRYQLSSEKPSPSSERLNPKEKNVATKWGEFMDAFKAIGNFGEAGQKISQSTWQDEELTSILFEYLFGDYLTRSPTSFELLLSKKGPPPELWKLIRNAENKLDSIKNLDETARAL